ncbi:hypothetical protein N0V88_005025 [Collariella sp. IMI 366227]|nr:hypothetical protein N0V88_005025 [Collariella sp. IMI 366227]
MDAPEEDLDIKLQKISSDLIADFDKSLPHFLRKPDGAVRSRVRTRETERLISALTRRHSPSRTATLRSDLLMPLPRAICRLVYTFCKIRGEKVVVRFLSNEAKYLEVLLSALEEAERNQGVEAGGWTWEERYVVLLWLSHLLLAPFDLASISSQEVEEEDLVAVEGLRWPGGLPSITTRLLPVAIKYLASPGKERDASKVLLVRISMRRDMQGLGVLEALVNWALVALKPREGVERTPYHYIGVLSFLAGILVSSADTSDMDRYLPSIFNTVHGIAAEEDKVGTMMSSALARKTMIKVLRAMAVLVLRNEQDMAGMELVETTIGFLLESLADNDTPVRFAASKALSIITLKLDTEMASQVVEAVLESLNKNVLHARNPEDPSAAPKKDLSMVDSLEWHGLMLTLSHLLYRRSPPAENLAAIVHALLMGLSFERRSTSGSSTGANVRDAACFGIWSLARRYTTPELLAVPTASLTTGHHRLGSSILQIIATDLVCAACLDPSGNIRRGSSAALQELIGRHSDIVEKGIWVVQTVDYHAVALRSRAVQDVAFGVTKLAGQYGEAILDALLGWRGVGDVDAASRRNAGASYGMIAAELASTAKDPLQSLTQSASLVLDRIKALENRQVEERHGLFFSFAAVLDALPAAAGSRRDSTLEMFVQLSLDSLSVILKDCDTKTYRKPELIAESASQLIIASFPALQASTSATADLLPGHSLKSKSGPDLAKLVESVDVRSEKLSTIIALIGSNLQKWLVWPDLDIIEAASEAAVVLMMFCTNAERDEAIGKWAEASRARQASKTRTTSGHFSALAAVYPLASALALDDQSIICGAIMERWRTDKETDTRACILQSLMGSELLRQNMYIFIDIVVEGLEDYTTTARGDVGSNVRYHAIRVTKSLWEAWGPENEGPPVVSGLFLRILLLAAEKLDRVRAQAQAALAVVLKPTQAAALQRSTFSSKSYFLFLLDLLQEDWLHPAIDEVKTDPAKWMAVLMSGLVSSADTGNEELVISTRAALCDFCERSAANTDAVCGALARNLRAWQGIDRVLVPTLEVVAFLFHVGIFQQCSTANYKSLCLQVQKACYKTGNVRKIEACIRVYGAIAELGRGGAAAAAPPAGNGSDPRKEEEGVREARARLGALMFHPLAAGQGCGC